MSLWLIPQSHIGCGAREGFREVPLWQLHDSPWLCDQPGWCGEPRPAFQFTSSVSSFSLNIYCRLIGHPLSERDGGLDENHLAEIVQAPNDDYGI